MVHDGWTLFLQELSAESFGLGWLFLPGSLSAGLPLAHWHLWLTSLLSGNKKNSPHKIDPKVRPVVNDVCGSDGPE